MEINGNQIEVYKIVVRRRVERAEYPSAPVDLTMAAKLVSVVGQRAVHVLRAVVEGKLQPFSAISPEEVEPGELLFDKALVREYIDIIQNQNGWVDREYVAKRFSVKITVISQWVEAGIIHPIVKHASKHYFSRNRIEDFRARYVFTEAAAKILGVGILIVQKWARRQRIDAISGPGIDDCHRYLLDRTELLAWRQANYLSAPAMANRLGISHSQLLSWIKTGKVTPISGPGIDEFKHYLFVPPDEDFSDD